MGQVSKLTSRARKCFSNISPPVGLQSVVFSRRASDNSLACKPGQPQNPEASLKLVSKTFTLPFIAIRLLGSLQSLYAFIQVCFSLKNLFRLPSSLLYLLIVMQFCQARRLRNLQAIIQNFGFIQICLSLQGSLHNL